MGYFRELPNILYQSPLLDKNSSLDYIVVKNLFRRVKLLDWLQGDNTGLYYSYQIEEGERPDTIADNLYGSPDYDWVLIITANITNIQDQWPLNHQDLYEYAVNKYTLEKLNDIHHYETKEIKDAKGRLILGSGLIVDSNFRIPAAWNSSDASVFYNVNTQETVKNTTTEQEGNSSVWWGVAPPTVTDSSTQLVDSGLIDPTVGISNWEYETKLNEEKRSLEILDPRFLQQFLNDMRNIMYYEKSSQYVNERTIQAENTRLIGP